MMLLPIYEMHKLFKWRKKTYHKLIIVFIELRETCFLDCLTKYALDTNISTSFFLQNFLTILNTHRISSSILPDYASCFHGN